MAKKKQTIIFDFDGTIADSYEYVLSFLRREAGRKKRVTDHEQVELRGYSMARMVRKLGMPWWQMPTLFLKGRREMAQHINDLDFFAGMEEVVRELNADGHQLFIVSSNSAVNIEKFLVKHNLSDCITKVYGGAGILGKAPILRRLLKDYALDAKACSYVGDESRDVQAARRVGMQSIAVTWGYNNASLLHKQKPTAIAFEPEDITKFVLGA